MLKLKTMLGVAIGQVKCFFSQTFRRHSGEEYSQFLTRGLRGEKGIQRAYPWFYIRLFAACVILFAVYLLIVRFTSNSIFVPITIILASLTFNLPFLVLLYEIYPRNDVSLLSVFINLLIGGTCACVLAQILYALIPTHGEWLIALRAAGVEELAKSLAVIITLIVLRIKHPLVGFIMGAAIGCGFSVVEDAGYIFLASQEMTELNVSGIVLTSLDRGVTAFCTHTMWSAAVGWAFASARRPYISFRLWACLAGVLGLHFLWNSPLSGGLRVIAIAVCVVITFIFGVTVLAVSRLATFEEAGEEPTPEFFSADERTLKRNRQYYVHGGHLCLTVGAFLMALIAIIYCTVPMRETYYAQTFSNKEEFISFMQCGYELSDDLTRPYDPYYHSTIETSNGNVYMLQKVTDDNYTYYYRYAVAGSGQNAKYILDSVSVDIGINGVYSRYFKETVYSSGGIEYASYFRVRADVTEIHVLGDGRRVSALIYDPSFEYDYSQPQYVILFCTLGGLAAISLIQYVIFWLKARTKGD